MVGHTHTRAISTGATVRPQRHSGGASCDRKRVPPGRVMLAGAVLSLLRHLQSKLPWLGGVNALVPPGRATGVDEVPVKGTNNTRASPAAGLVLIEITPVSGSM
ncbi:MAG: hypothetical protein RLZZ123_2832, partial [Pseudomonadota bacterium]